MRKDIKNRRRKSQRNAGQYIGIKERHNGWICERIIFMSQRGKKLLDAAIWMAERIR